MNKIFKVVWSKSKNCYVVVSEFAKNNSGKKKIVVAAILAALAMTNASISMAANTLPTKLHATAVGLGDGASVTGDKAVGFGQNAAAAGGYSIAIGSNSSTSVNSPQGIAIGGGNTANEGARVIGEQAIAIGGNTIAQGNSSIVIGGDDVVKADGVKVIYTTNNGEIQTGDLRSAVQSLTGFDMRNPLYTTATAGESGITLGMKGQSGNVGIAIGTGANAKDRLSGPSGQANNDVTNAIAIGTGARANRDNAIAIGGGSNTDVGGTKQSSYTLPNNVVASWAGGDKTLPGDVVSFGSKGYERQLKHVAPGEVSATSTDAINGSQLSAIVDQIAYKYISIKSSDVANKDNTGATADNSIAIGPNAATDTSASRSVAVGDGARGKVVDGVAVGSKSIADIASGVAGYNVNASRTDIYAGLSGAALTSKLGGVAVGTINQTRQINYVAAGTADTDAVNVAQLKSVNLAFTGDTGTGDVNLANSKLAVNGDNTYISTTANGKKITVSGKKQDITVANGSATASAGMADSANVANAINQAIDQNKYGWNLSANGEATPVAVEKGNTVDFSGDDNVAVARNDKKISVALKKDLSKLNSASFNNASGNETVKIDGNKGINAGNLKVANVADGVADKDAVNVSQLKKVDDKAEANKTAIDKNIGEIATNKGDIASNKANIAQNTVAIARKISLGGNSGSTDEKSLSTGDVKFNVKGENGLTTVANGDDVTVKLDDATKGKVDNAADRDLSNLTPDGKQQVKDLAAWNVVANNEMAEKVEGGNTVKFIDGDNISITQNGKDFTISTKKDVTFDTVTATQTITAPKVKATTGVETPQVTGLTNTAWVPGQTQPVSGRAATEDQLKHVDDQVAENKANITDNTDKIGKNADAIADNKQKIADNKTAIDKNAVDIATNKDNIAANKTDIATNKDNIADNKQKIADNKTAITKNTDNIATNRQNIADNKAAITKNASDIVTNKDNIATNKANIDKNTTAIGRKISLGGNSGSTDEKSLSTGDVKFNVKGENGLTTVANGDDVTVKLDDATKGKVDNAADRDLSNLTPDGKQQVKDLAAWNVVANNEMAEKVEGGNTVKFIDGDNISITQNGKDFTISTKKDVTFDTVTATQTITAPKVKATTGVETPQVTGLTNTAWVPGQTQPVSGRAATEDQLKHVDDQVAENKANITDNTDKIGKNADAIADNKQKIADNKTAIDKNAVDIATNKDNIAANKTDIATNKDNIADNKQKIADNKTAIDKNTGDIATNKADISTNKDNIAINKANIDKNTTAIGRKISLGGNSGSTDEKSLSTGDVKFNVKGENGLTTVANGDDVTVKLDDTTKGKIENAADQDLSNLTPDGKQQVKDLSAWNVVANDNTAQRVEGGNTVKFIDGDNISITQNGKDFTISTKKDVTFDTVTATQTITAPKVKATTGVETPQVTGLTNTAWVPGQTQPVSGRAATEDQLKHVDDQVAENKANITDNTDKIGKNADAIADNKQKIADNKTAIDKNAVDIATNKDNIAANKADIATNKDNIADNKQKIADNKSAIDKNTGDIATNKDNIAKNKDNIDKNTTAIARKISLGGNSGSTNEKSLSTGDVKFNVKGENGLTTVANGDDVTVKLDDATKGKVDNAADRDLSNLTPDGKQQVKDLAAWNVVANNEMAEKVEGGNTVKFIDGDNISITQNGKDFTISTKKDVTFDTVTATQTITAPKVKATTGVETPQVTGLTNTAWVPGQTQPVSGRAATEDQLKHVDDQVSENKAKIADNTDKIGKNAEAIADNKQKIADNKAAIDKNAVDIATNKDNIATNKADIATNKDNITTNKQNIADNKAAITKNAGDIAANKANIDKNTEAIGRKISLGGNTGSTDEKSLSTGDVKFNIKGQNGIVTEANGDDVTVKLDDATANKINNAANTDLSNLTDAGKQQVKDLSAWNVVANGNTAEKVEGGNTVKFIDGDNISITQNGKDFTIATKQDVTFNTVKANQTITAPKVKATEGVETPQVTGLTNTAWTPGQTPPVSGRAATEDQLKHVDDQVAENKANIADNTDKIGKNADAIADNKQKIANNKAAIDRNAADIATNKDNIAANKQNIADNKAAITKNTSDIATNKDNIATNKANIDKNTTAIARKISLGGNSGLTDEKSLSTGDVKFNIKGENGLTTIANGEDVTVKIDDQTKAKIDNAANQDLSNLTETGKQQVKDISAWKVTAAGGTVEKVQGSDTVKFQAGDNLVVNQDRTTFTYGLAKDLKGLNSVTVGDENGVSTKITPAGTTVKDAAGNSTTINGGGMTITPADTAASPVSLTVDGLNNGGNKIHGVAPGTADTDAVNVSQLKASNAGLQEAVNRVGTETQRVGAHAAAMAALKPIQYDPLEPTQIMAGIGNYRGETAGAIGIAHYRTEDTMFNVGVSLGTSHNMVNAGITHKFGGSRERKDAIPERYKAGPISSVYVMQDEVSSLKKENSNQKTVIANQAARLNTLEAENERQRQELAETKQGLDDLRAVVNQLLASKG